MNINNLIEAVKPIEAYKWEEFGLTVVQDGYLSDGTRVHVVQEYLKKEPVTLSNAIVVSENFLNINKVDAKKIGNNISFKADLKQVTFD
ncbi:hypothetical protein [Vibrio fluvialis]|uniref:hypothetical protein n=1 Tax=Vibrio fluvialis TaxID=676 RepID=UPI001EEC1AA1|nr:hypothetical protein [Vibrio fluvialis]MCG6414595.1 hypothetical protein [Vibrio fluvialis]